MLYMEPLTNHTWDIQFSHDGAHHANLGKLQGSGAWMALTVTGWIFSRGSQATADFWKDCLDDIETNGGWDQAIVHTRISKFDKLSPNGDGSALYEQQTPPMNITVLPRNPFHAWHAGLEPADG